MKVIQKYQNIMQQAYEMAQKAFDNDEIPVAAIITYNDQIIASATNQSNKENNPLLHAEMIALAQAIEFCNQQSIPLNQCSIFVTLEPCLMCSGALINSKIKQIIFSAYDTKNVSLSNIVNNDDFNLINHKPEIIGGIMEQQNKDLIKEFFKNKR